MGAPRHLARAQGPLGTGKGLVGKLFDIGLAGIVVDDGVVIGALRLGRLEPLDERLCEGEAVVVGRVEALADDLVDGVILA